MFFVFDGDREELVRRLHRAEIERQRAIDDVIGWQDQLHDANAELEETLLQKWQLEKELREREE